MPDDEKQTNQGKSPGSNQGNRGAKEGAGKSRSSRRRYFRRKRRKGEASQAKQSPPGQEAAEGPSQGASGSRKRRKRRKSRRRRTTRADLAGLIPPVPDFPVVEENEDYQEPDDIYIYTCVLRPAYRNVTVDFRPEQALTRHDTPAEPEETAALAESGPAEAAAPDEAQADQPSTDPSTGSDEP